MLPRRAFAAREQGNRQLIWLPILHPKRIYQPLMKITFGVFGRSHASQLLDALVLAKLVSHHVPSSLKRCCHMVPGSDLRDDVLDCVPVGSQLLCDCKFTSNCVAHVMR